MAQQLRADLATITATVPLNAVQGATIVCEVTEKLERWIRTKRPADVVVPTVEDISITQGGAVWWCRGRAVAASRVVPSLGALLEALLHEASALRRTPAGLLYIVARATDPCHLAPFETLNDFKVTLSRYAALQRQASIDALLAHYSIAHSGLPPLSPGTSSISDVRRLRRAGGIPLQQISEDTGIPISLLRELEWGVYANWPLEYARAALSSYAERAGLDAEAVVQVVAREQTLALPEPAVAAPATPAVSLTATTVPFVLAALLLATLMIAAPGDRTPGPPPARARATQPTTPANMPALVPAANPAVALGPRPGITRASHTLIRRNRPAAQAARRAQPTDRADEPHPIVRFAKTIAGDGRFKVEPFPKPR